MSETLPKCCQNEPYVVDVEAKRYSWCTCGLAATQPFCDGAHKGTDFRSHKIEFSEPQTVAFCGCKKTKNPPYCDGSHNG